MPMHVSRTQMTAAPSSPAAATSTSPRSGVNLTAFDSRLISTLSSWAGLPETIRSAAGSGQVSRSLAEAAEGLIASTAPVTTSATRSGCIATPNALDSSFASVNTSSTRLCRWAALRPIVASIVRCRSVTWSASSSTSISR
jgi:hypothetical protein